MTDPKDPLTPSPLRDTLARLLAAQAGYCWENLNNHPGYLREIFREQAQLLIELVER